ncbi:MAG TPA: nidogen-like domain-containing protein [Acetobacteraceae bacterium]|nr:nidogen-like domain-containing protein [Acetobacteraceae bacterium]
MSGTIASGFNASQLPRNDDDASGAVPLGFSADFFGPTYSSVFVSNNGYLTFGTPETAFTPTGLGASYSLGVPIIAAFFADVDTRNPGSGVVTYGTGTFAGHAAFGATWPAVGYFFEHADKLDTFQIILTDRSDTGAGNFDIYFNYGSIQWETGDFNGGVNGLGGVSASAGFNAGTGNAAGTFSQITGSLTNGAFINGGPDALASTTNDGVPGQFLFLVRGGMVAPPGPPGPPTPPPPPPPPSGIDFSALNQNLMLAILGLGGLAGVLDNLGANTTNAGQLSTSRNAAGDANNLASLTIPADESAVQTAFAAGLDLGPSATQLMSDVRQEATLLITANASALNAGASPASLTDASNEMLAPAGNFLGMANSYQTSTSAGVAAQQALTGAIAAFPPPPGTDPPPPGGPQSQLLVADTTTGMQIPATGIAYTGPVAGVQEQYLNLTPDNLNIAASSPSWFIHSGSGMDAISVASGTNVLDGGTGSNFMTGGSGTDTFYIDDRRPTADIWTTVNNMHAGDAVTVWGVTPQDFSLTWQDNQGAAGFTGLTLHATAPGMPTASLTLVGYSTADLDSGRLSVSFNPDQASATPYVFIHA